MPSSSNSNQPQSSKNIASLKQPAHRVNFRVISCTSADNNFTAAELELQSPESRGWVSQRFCTYPQIITIKLTDLAIVQKLTFLSHQSKITTKVDIECKQKQIDMWKKLGYTCMQSNMTTNYEARQLRTVKLNKQLAQFFKFTLHPNYVNTINVFNQVALIAISLYGERYHPKPLDDMKERGILPPGAILDKETLDKLRQLEYMKRDAIESNDFEKASQLKQEIDKLKSGVEALAILEKHKKDAIRREDYEQAKKIYQKMKKIRGPIPRVVVSSNDRYEQQNINKSMEYERGSFTPIVNNIKKIKNKSMAFDQQKPIKGKESPILQLKKKKVLPEVIKPPKIINIDEIRVGPKSDGNIYEQAAFLDEQERAYNQSLPESPRVKQKPEQKSKFNRNRLGLDQKQVYGQEKINKQLQDDQEQKYGGKLPPECEQYFPVVLEMIFKNIFTGDKNMRQHGLEEALKLVDKIEQQDFFQKLFINAVIFIVKHTIEDKIVSILLKSVDLIGMMFKEYKPKPEQIQRQNQRNLKKILEKLSEYIGHPNEKLKNQVEDVYIVLPKYSKSTSKQLCIEIITLNEKIDRAPRSIISKLIMLGQLIRKYDWHALKSKSSIVNDKKKDKYQEVVQYAKRFLQDRNSEVRTTAVKLLVYLGKIIGTNQLLSALDDVRQTTKKLIEEKLLNRNQNQEAQSNNVPKEQMKGVAKRESPKNRINNSPRQMSPKKSPQKDIRKAESPQTNKNKPLPPWKKPAEKQSQIPQTNKKQQNKQLEQPYIPKNPEYICEYCQQEDKRLENQTFRDIHLSKHCPLITICKECKQCVEVELLNQHMVQECEKNKFWKKCPRCKESVLGKLYNQHVEKKTCIAAKPLNVANRCPHCHEDIEPKKRGWIKHLIEEGCPCQKDRST